MTRETFIRIARSVVRNFNPEDIERPIQNTSLDSMDLLLLRSALESETGQLLTDEQWFATQSLQSLLEQLR